MSVNTRTRGVVVDTSHSAHAQLRPVPLDAVTIADAFWTPRIQLNRDVTIPAQHRQLWDTGRVANLQRAAGKLDGEFQGRYFNDSDIYKWIEAASWSLATNPNPDLERDIDALIAEVADAQRQDGYLNSYFARDKADERWTDFDLHEMYCAGHLFQAAVAHHRATGASRLLDIACRFADHIRATFGPPEEGKRVATDGHPEVEMGLVELGRETGERAYVDQAQFLLDVRGHGILGSAYDRFGTKYHQDHQPFRELDEIVGHAVRAVYLNAGAADIYAETGERAIGDALHRLWQNMTTKKMYVSGGIGSRYDGESFGADYELPNAQAYTETCAAIGSIMWNWRMLLIENDARYADLIEHTLYNAVLPGVSLDGQTYFYQNPLADEGTHRRQAWFRTACCPPNVARLLASLPGYFYSVADDDVWVHLYAEGSARIPLSDGRTVELGQQTRYPWDGEIALEVQSEGSFALKLRIPGWCEEGATLAVNGEQVTISTAAGEYAEVRRDWQRGDSVRLSLPMPVRQVACHPKVAENTGRIALMRGPLLYCVEGIDNPGVHPHDIVLASTATVQAAYQPQLLNGVVILTGEAQVMPPDESWTGKLYQTVKPGAKETSGRAVPITAIPYYAWANREPGPMRVWLRQQP